MNRRDDGSVHEAAETERQEVEAVVNQVELTRPFEHSCDVQRFPHLRIDCRVLFVAHRRRTDELRACNRVGRCEERHVDSPRDETFRQERGELLPRSVVPRRHTPRDRSEHGDTKVRGTGRIDIDDFRRHGRMVRRALQKASLGSARGVVLSPRGLHGRELGNLGNRHIPPTLV